MERKTSRGGIALRQVEDAAVAVALPQVGVRPEVHHHCRQQGEPHQSWQEGQRLQQDNEAAQVEVDVVVAEVAADVAEPPRLQLLKIPAI